MRTHIGPETSLFWDTATWSFVARAEGFPVGNFLVSTVLVCVASILISCGLLWFRMPGGYSTARKELNTFDPRCCVPQFGCGTWGEWFHVVACKINRTDEEYADMQMSGNLAAERYLYFVQSFLNRRTRKRYFKHQLWISTFVQSVPFKTQL
jgi:hypothetical protein